MFGQRRYPLLTYTRQMKISACFLEKLMAASATWLNCNRVTVQTATDARHKIDLDADTLSLLQNAAVLNSQDRKQSCSLSAGVFQGSAFEILVFARLFRVISEQQSGRFGDNSFRCRRALAPSKRCEYDIRQVYGNVTHLGRAVKRFSVLIYSWFSFGKMGIERDRKYVHVGTCVYGLFFDIDSVIILRCLFHSLLRL
ncbi:MAG: hypothetical protein MR332_00500 [Fusicatenibacter sp.]|nr:hypothetical protein [Fusicatenibacter sp.]